MKSFILIPAYLLKNTLQRWLENPASPLTKIIITFLFSILAFLIFGSFQLFEKKITAQLNRDDLRSITTQEQLWADRAQERLYNGTDESYLWLPFSEEFNTYQQASLYVDTLLFKKVPLLSYDTPPSIPNFPTSEPGQARPIVVFSKQSFKTGSDYILIQDNKIPAISLPLPPIFKSRYNSPAVAVIPNEMITPLLERGFSQIQVILPKKSVPTNELQQLIQAHAHAEGRRVNITSSVEILSKLQEFLNHQKNARLIVGSVITAILSLTLGALSLLEFRQEQYLSALLRSFGVKKGYLFIHYLLETSALTLSGLWLASRALTHLVPILLEHSHLGKETQPFIETISSMATPEDYQTLIMAISLGVLISSLPVALGLRKQIGLFLP